MELKYSLLITILIIHSSCVYCESHVNLGKTDHKYRDIFIRNLLPEKTFNDNCLAYNLSEYLSNYLLKDTTTYDPLLWESTSTSSIIITYIQQRNEKSINDYAQKAVIQYLVFFIFALISFITWFVFWICCYSPYCNCQYKESESGKCKQISFLIVIICGICSIIVSISGIATSTKFNESVNMFSCSLMSFYLNLRNGKLNSNPKWTGVDNIILTINSTRMELIKLPDTYESTFKNIDDLNAKSSNFEKSLSKLYSNHSTETLNNYNPAQSTRNGKSYIDPIYIQNLGNYMVNGTYLNTIYSEYNSKFKTFVNQMNQIKILSTEITENLDTIDNLLSIISTTLLNVKSHLDYISDKVIQPWTDWKEERLISILSFSTTLFALIIFLQIINLVFIFCYVKLNFQAMRFVNHFVWIFLTLITFISFSLGAGFGTAGVVARDLIPVLGYILGEENLLGKKYLIDDKRTAETIDICLNYGGDLANEFFGVETTEFDYLSQFYEQANTLTDALKQMNSTVFKTSSSILTVSSDLNNISQNIKLIIPDTNNTNSPLNILQEMLKWSNSINNNTYQTNCSTYSKDIWAQRKELCENGYTYASADASNTGANFGSPVCLLWNEWTQNSVSLRYTSSSAGCVVKNQNFISTVDAIVKYWQSLNSITTDNKKLIDSLLVDLQTVSTIYQDLGEQIIKESNKVTVYSSSIVNIFNSLVGQNKLYTFINCSYLKEDLFSIFAIMKDTVSPYAISLGVIFIIASFLNYISLIFLLIVIFKNIEKKRKVNPENKEETPEKQNAKNEPHSKAVNIEMKLLAENKSNKSETKINFSHSKL